MSTYKLNSSDVQVFPSAYRSNGFNPEARLNSEFNLRNFTNSLTDFDGFVINYKESEKNKVITFNLLGYYFKLDLTTALSNYSSASGILCAGIKLLNFNNTITDDNKEFEGQTLSNLSRNTITGLDSEGTDEEPAVFSGIELFLDSDTYTNENNEQKPQSEKYTAYLKLLTLPSRVVPIASRFKFSGDSITTDNLNKITDCFTTNCIESGVDNDCCIDLEGLIDIHSASTLDLSSVGQLNIASDAELDLTGTSRVSITSPEVNIVSPSVLIESEHIGLGGETIQHVYLDNNGSSQLLVGVGGNSFDKITFGSTVEFSDDVIANDITAKNINVPRTDPVNSNTDGVVTCYQLNSSVAQITQGSIQSLSAPQITSNDIRISNDMIELGDGSWLTASEWNADKIDANNISVTNLTSTKIDSTEIVSKVYQINGIAVNGYADLAILYDRGNAWFNALGLNAIIPMDAFLGRNSSYSNKCYWLWSVEKTLDRTSTLNPTVSYDSKISLSNGRQVMFNAATKYMFNALEKIYDLYTSGRIKKIIYTSQKSTSNIIVLSTYNDAWEINIERAYKYYTLPSRDGNLVANGVSTEEYTFLFSMSRTNPCYWAGIMQEDDDIYGSPADNGYFKVFYN